MFNIPEQPPKYMFWLARIFGKRLSPTSVSWLGKIWVHQKIEYHSVNTPQTIKFSRIENPKKWMDV